MLRFIHAADLHLDSAFRALGPGKAARLRQERRETLFRLADYVNGHGVGLVLLAGDVFDGGGYRETREAALVMERYYDRRYHKHGRHTR